MRLDASSIGMLIALGLFAVLLLILFWKKKERAALIVITAANALILLYFTLCAMDLFPGRPADPMAWLLVGIFLFCSIRELRNYKEKENS